MLKSYFLLALRTLRRHRGYALINICGLATGMACCLLMLSFVRHELSYDAFHADADRIFRLARVPAAGTAADARVALPAALAPALRAEIPEVEQAVRYNGMQGEVLVTAPSGRFYEDGFYFADSTFFDLFSFRLLRGNPERALARPFTLVLTAPLAEKYFGEADPVGRTLTLDNVHTFEVTGVVEAPPSNSYFRFDMLASYPTRYLMDRRLRESWFGHWDETFVRLRARTAVAALLGKLPALAARGMGAEAGAEAARQGADMRFIAQPIRDLHLKGVPVPRGSLQSVYLFSMLALLVLGIAAINYMNLSTARFADRAREVGVRKAVGARRSQLVVQFLSESVLFSLLALVLAVVLVELARPAFVQAFGPSLALDYRDAALPAGLFVAVALAVGVLAGSYPAFFLSGFRPVRVLKGRLDAGGRTPALWIRKGLVVLQFAVSTVLIVATLVVWKQLAYVQSRPLGFDREQVVSVPTRGLLGAQYAAFKQALLQHPGITHVTTSSGLPAHPSFITYRVSAEGVEERPWITAYAVDGDFVETLGLKLAAGRDLSADHATDARHAVLVNEELVRAFGWADPIGKTIAFSEEEQMRVVGVIEDFHYQSLREALTPLLFHLTPAASRFVAVRLQTQDTGAALAHLRAVWDRFLPAWPFEYAFLDRTYAQLYEAEERLSRIIGTFSVLAVLVACLGLFGLALFSAEQRTREIGIRKVLGADVPGLVLLLTKDFLALVAAAWIVAAPVAYVVMRRWLEDFAYRVEPGSGPFLLAGLAVLAVAFATVSRQALRAALANPADSLRHE